jgi:tetratricopeptide (TPR) repeat protein
VYETLVRQELDLPPDRDVLVLAAKLRGTAGESAPAPLAKPGAHGSPTGQLPPQPQSSITESATGEIPDVDLPVAQQSGHTSGWATLSVPRDPVSSTPIPLPPRSRAWLPWAAAAVVVIGVSAAIVRWTGRPVVAAPPAERIVAVGRIAHYAQSGQGGMGQPLADMLATNLARAAGVRVISSARMYELLGELSTASDTVTGSIVAAARRAGATELVDGALYDVSAGHLRLDLRRVDLSSGAVLRAYTIQGPDLFTLADSGTGRLVDDLGGRAPVGSLADVSTRSVEAYRAYEAGLRAYYAGNLPGAEKLFGQALSKDSSFAMAQFYYSLSTSSGSRAEGAIRLKRAVELAERASDRERLLIRATWAFSNSSPSVRAYAETLTVRYPTELEGFIMAGQGAINAADFHAARAPLLEVIARDSLGFKGQTVRCLGCEALAALIGSMSQEDSLAAALALAQRWVRLQPTAANPRRYTALVLAQMGMADSSRRALRAADSLEPGISTTWKYLIPIQMWDNHFDSAGELARSVTQTGESQERTEGYWNLAIAYRHLGRLNEALELSKNYRAGKAEIAARGSAPLSAYLEGQVLFELGRFKEAAALFDSISRTTVPFEDSSLAARNRVWSYTHLATALAAAGDTSRLVALADTMQRLGQVSGLERDRRLHHYVRGLIFKARGMDEQAVSEFRIAITSRNSGYTRIDYELAGALMRLKRPGEAVASLQMITRSMFEGASLYLSHTEAHERLAQAWEAAGQRDSAATHYRLVARLWENADPGFTPRRLEAAGRAMQLLEKN